MQVIWAKLKAGWMRFAHALGSFNTRVLLTLVFFTLFAIVSIVMKLLRRDPLRTRGRGIRTLWLPADPPSDPDPIAAHRRQF